MSRALPPLNALRAFEAAARHLSFTQAAAELNVTPAAISHQVKALEAWAGAPLFHRLTRAMRLTEAGAAALPMLIAGLDGLAEGAAALRAAPTATPLRVSVSPGFGSLWLVPRLDRFHARHPEIDLRLDGTDVLADVAGGAADVAIRYGPGDYPGLIGERLFALRNVPVCAPALIEDGPPLRRPADLAGHTLLHVEWVEPGTAWSDWLRAAGAPEVEARRGPTFTREEMAVRAALDGKGVALIGDRLVADHVAAGRLVLPFEGIEGATLDQSYHLLVAAGRERAEASTAFRDWLLGEARST